jgi:hypothetical protein
MGKSGRMGNNVKKSNEKAIGLQTNFANENAPLENKVTETNSIALGEPFVGAICPNCGARLEGRKCKLFCPTPGCGYLVTCSEW